MTQVTQAAFQAGTEVDLESTPAAARAKPAGTAASDISLTLYRDLVGIEREWRAFEDEADCTVFQTFDWLATWQLHIGSRSGVTPAIVVGRHDGRILFILPLALEPGAVRRVAWLGSYLCNYNGPLIAQDFSARVNPVRFAALWRDVRALLRERLRYDLIDLEKMPETVGAQPNPLLAQWVTPHVNDAYLTNLTGNWEKYYSDKRGSATRKTDRKKRKRLAEHGEVKFITANDDREVERCLDALIDEKRRAYAKLGVGNMFEWSGYRDFFLAVATGAQSRRLTHVSRFEVGDAIAAANYGLTFRGRYYYILAGYDDGDLARFGPGAAQLMELLRYTTDGGFKQFDFTIGDEPYKREWLDVETRLFDRVSPATVRGWLVAVPLVAVRQTKRWIKRNPRVWSFVRKVRSMLGSLRRR